MLVSRFLPFFMLLGLAAKLFFKDVPRKLFFYDGLSLLYADGVLFRPGL